MNPAQRLLAAEAEIAAAQMALLKLQVGRELDLTEAESEALPDGDIDSLVAEARKVAASKADQFKHAMAKAVGMPHSAEPEVKRERVVVVRSGAMGPDGPHRPVRSLADLLGKHLKGER